MRNFLKPAPDKKVLVPEDKIKSTYIRMQIGILISTCLGYTGYYICRQTFTYQQKDLIAAYDYTKEDIGMVLGVFGVSYGIFKLIMGTLSDKANPKWFIATGLFVSAFLNVLIGANSHNIKVVAFLMALMAISQGMGAPACQKSIQFWFGKKQRGTFFSVWSSAHNLGSFASGYLAKWATTLFAAGEILAFLNMPVTGVFYFCSAVSVLIGFIVLLTGNDRPASVGLPTAAEYFDDDIVAGTATTEDDGDTTTLSIGHIFIKYILLNKMVWFISLTSASLYMVRYGIMSWVPSFLSEQKGELFTKESAKAMTAFFELSAIPGVIFLGYATDKFLKGRRTPAIIVGILLSFIAILVYYTSMNKGVIIIDMFIMANLIYAPITIVGLMVNESVPKFAAGASTGFMGFFQYIVGNLGATWVMGRVIDQMGWDAAFVLIYAAGAFAVVCMVFVFFFEAAEAKKGKLKHDIKLVPTGDSDGMAKDLDRIEEKAKKTEKKAAVYQEYKEKKSEVKSDYKAKSKTVSLDAKPGAKVDSSSNSKPKNKKK
jgi:OPA family glycerol-3-phosphate transporter-like MFS transporter